MYISLHHKTNISLIIKTEANELRTLDYAGPAGRIFYYARHHETDYTRRKDERKNESGTRKIPPSHKDTGLPGSIGRHWHHRPLLDGHFTSAYPIGGRLFCHCNGGRYCGTCSKA